METIAITLALVILFAFSVLAISILPELKKRNLTAILLFAAAISLLLASAPAHSQMTTIHGDSNGYCYILDDDGVRMYWSHDVQCKPDSLPVIAKAKHHKRHVRAVPIGSPSIKGSTDLTPIGEVQLSQATTPLNPFTPGKGYSYYEYSGSADASGSTKAKLTLSLIGSSHTIECDFDDNKPVTGCKTDGIVTLDQLVDSLNELEKSQSIDTWRDLCDNGDKSACMEQGREVLLKEQREEAREAASPVVIKGEYFETDSSTSDLVNRIPVTLPNGKQVIIPQTIPGTDNAPDVQTTPWHGQIIIPTPYVGPTDPTPPTSPKQPIGLQPPYGATYAVGTLPTTHEN